MSQPRELVPGNNFVRQVYLEDISDTTGTRSAHTSGAPTAFITVTDTSLSAAVHSSVSVTMVYVGGQPKGDGSGTNYDAGTWQAFIAGSSIVAATLDPLIPGGRCWFVVSYSGNVLKREAIVYRATSRASVSSV